MKIGPLNRWAVVGAVLAVLLVNLQLATSQSQQRVQSTTQLSVRTPVLHRRCGPSVAASKPSTLAAPSLGARPAGRTRAVGVVRAC